MSDILVVVKNPAADLRQVLPAWLGSPEAQVYAERLARALEWLPRWVKMGANMAFAAVSAAYQVFKEHQGLDEASSKEADDEVAALMQHLVAKEEQRAALELKLHASEERCWRLERDLATCSQSDEPCLDSDGERHQDNEEDASESQSEEDIIACQHQGHGSLSGSHLLATEELEAELPDADPPAASVAPDAEPVPAPVAAADTSTSTASSGAWSVSAPDLLENVLVVPDRDVFRFNHALLGEGGSAKVNLAYGWRFGKPFTMAVKSLKPQHLDDDSSDTLRMEADIMRGLKHPNVLGFYGVVVDVPGSANVTGLLLEHMRGGSLRQHLQHWPLKHRCQVARQVAEGMAYLHSLGVVHFDLKPDNLLVDGEGKGMTVKIADFGIARRQRQAFFTGFDGSGHGTLAFMAPELMLDCDHVSEKADVWSMGVLLWQMLTLRAPYQGMSGEAISSALQRNALHELLLGAVSPHYSENLEVVFCEPEWLALLHMCLAPVPSDRPSFSALAAFMDHVILEQQEQQQQV